MDQGTKLIKEFVETSIKYGAAQLEGDHRAVNTESEKLTNLRLKFKAISDFNYGELVTLLEHEDGYVRLKAAFTIISYAPEKARYTLVELSKERGLLGMEANMILQEWEAGKLIEKEVGE
ncbi:hypothetical protein PaecuDRAFT_4366 [Paenibacillus curdlanolyticus YK9]|uniref:Uncharacterized protein n=1 Tax=Paenibacillus curdlanolyticus YK9 TaxID=717606 RepID=E0IFC5_9BACL|nr:DUF2019 domain-containing protein [Paenibacillus curdlanolyticus]EFM08901.1 hypothetical protein PaecuDRAFT_4366 [Paenibacillus curdlanolyticus YK9]